MNTLPNVAENLTDEEAAALVERVQNGDKPAEEKLVNHFARLAVRVSTSFHHHKSTFYDEDDMLQDALIAILEQAQSYNGSVPFRSWVALGMRLKVWAAAWGEIRRKRRFWVDGVDLNDKEAFAVAFVEDTLKDTETHLDFISIVEAASLTERQREIMKLRARGVQISDIAERCGIHPATVNRDISKAMRALRALVDARP